MHHHVVQIQVCSNHDPGNKIDPQLGGGSNFFFYTNILKEKRLKDLLEKHSVEKPELVQIKV